MKNFNDVSSMMQQGDISFCFVNIPPVLESVRVLNGEPYLSCFGPWEQSYACGLRVNKRKGDFISGRLAAKLAVLKYLRADDQVIDMREIEIIRTDTGEPSVMFCGRPLDLVISISHSSELAVSGVAAKDSCRAIGIDIEKIEQRDNSFLDLAFSEDEINRFTAFIKGSEDESTLITRYWTVKESVMKSLGIGLNISLMDIEVSQNEAGKINVKIKNKAKERYDLLHGNRISVESFTLDGYVLSVARLQ